MLPRLLSLTVIAAAFVGGVLIPLPVTMAGSYAVHLYTGALLVGALLVLSRGRLFSSFLTVAVAAIGLEFVQANMLVGRAGDPSDALAGIAGALLMCGFMLARRALRSA